MDNCGVCKYFGEALTQFYDKGEEYKTMYHKCRKIEYMEHPPNHKNELAGVIDGSGYYAALVVSSDFGCINFEMKTSEEDLDNANN